MKITIASTNREKNPYLDRKERSINNIEQILKALQDENTTNMQNILNGNPEKYWDRVKKYQQEFQRRVAKVLDIN